MDHDSPPKWLRLFCEFCAFSRLNPAPLLFVIFCKKIAPWGRSIWEHVAINSLSKGRFCQRSILDAGVKGSASEAMALDTIRERELELRIGFQPTRQIEWRTPWG